MSFFSFFLQVFFQQCVSFSPFSIGSPPHFHPFFFVDNDTLNGTPHKTKKRAKKKHKRGKEKKINERAIFFDVQKDFNTTKDGGGGGGGVADGFRRAPSTSLAASTAPSGRRVSRPAKTSVSLYSRRGRGGLEHNKKNFAMGNVRVLAAARETTTTTTTTKRYRRRR